MNDNKTINLIYLYKFFAWFHMFSAILIPFFTMWAKLSVFQFMFLESWCMLCMLLFEIPTGGIADYLSRKASLQLGLVIQMIGFVIYVAIPNFYMFMLGELVVALGFSLISGAEESFIYDTVKSQGREKDSMKILGRAESFGLAGIMVAAPVGSFIAGKLGLSYPMFLMFIPLCIALILLTFMKEPLCSDKEKTKLSYFGTIKRGVLFFYNHKVIKILALDGIIITTTGFLMIWLYQIMLTDLGVNIAYFGIINTAFIALEIVLLNSYSKIENVLKSRKRIILWGSLIIGIMFIIGGLTKSIWVAIIVILTVISLSMTRRTLIINYINKYISSQNRATVISCVSMLVSLGKMLLFPIVGLIIDKTSVNIVLLGLGAFVIVFALTSKLEEKHLLDMIEE